MTGFPARPDRISPVGSEETSEPLLHYLRVLRRRKVTVAVFAMTLVGAAIGYSILRTPVYSAVAKVMVQPSGITVLSNLAGQRVEAARAVETEIEVLQSAPVRAAVEQKLGPVPSTSAAVVGDTNVIEVRVESSDPRKAARVANAYANAYIEHGRKRAVEKLLAASQEIQLKVNEVQAQIDALDRQVSAAPVAEREAVRVSIEDQKRALIEQQGAYKERVGQVQIDAALISSQAELVSAATPPQSPVKPQLVRNAVLALFLGLVLGVGLAFVVDRLDDSVKTNEDFERASKGVPVVGMIPVLDHWKAMGEPKVISMEQPRSPAAEAYRTACTTLQFAAMDEPIRSMAITSPGVEEGKSTTVANLAVTLANRGHHVVIACCDLRRPRIHEFFGLDNSVGMTSVLSGDTPLSSALQQVPGQDRISLLASGPLPSNPAELLSGTRNDEVLLVLRDHADVLLVDTPPILPVSDGLIVAGKVDAVLLASYAGATSKKEITRSVELLRRVKAPLIGAVLNGVTGESSSYYYDSRNGSRGFKKGDTSGNGRGAQGTAARKSKR